jgi:Cu+-exporting ATPase
MHIENPSQKALSGASAVYTCPVHSQKRHNGPGNCAICGMTLEPLVATAEESSSIELQDMSRRFWVGLVLTVPVFLCFST